MSGNQVKPEIESTQANKSTELPADDGKQESTKINVPPTDQNYNSVPSTTGSGDNPNTVDEQQQTDSPPAGQLGDSNYHYSLLRRPMRYDPVCTVFAVLVLVGGIIGYVTKGSTASLVSGTVFALLIESGTYIEGARRNSWPLIVVLFALGAMMLYRYSISLNFMPSGLIALLSFLLCARHCYLTYLRLRRTNV